MSAFPQSLWWKVGCVVVLAAALLLRISSLDRLPMWVDEAESSINALTILDHGVPIGTYLGMPIYENTNLAPWPENPEYRFKDVSYSKNDLAVYHGWVPLYSIAAALWVAGIHPDELTTNPSVQHTPEQRRLRTLVPRIPAVVFGLLGVIIFYFAGKTFYGKDAGVAAAVLSALSPMHIFVSQQARYFSATVTMSALCAYATWQIVHRRKWSDCILGGISFGLLFHTHVLTFAVAVLMLALAVGAAAYQKSFPWQRLVLFGCITTALVLPWAVLTDFIHAAATVPSAWRLMKLPDDLILYKILVHPATVCGVIAAAVIAVGVMRYRPSWATRIVSEFGSHKHSLLFLSVWLCASYLAFLFLIPAASYALTRMGVLLLAPATLLVACVCAGATRVISARVSPVIASILAVLIVAVLSCLWPVPSSAAVAMQQYDIDAAISYIARLPQRSVRKIYANPNDHLLLTYYSGVPVQSIAPVRPEFLHRYPGDVVLIEKRDFFVQPGDPIDPSHLLQAAKQNRISLSLQQAQDLSADLVTYTFRALAARRYHLVVPPPQPPPEFAVPLYSDWLRLHQQREREYAAKWVTFPIFRGFEIRSVTDWWTVFFFRFVNPEAELLRPNYESRMRNAVVSTLQGANWAVYYSPGNNAQAAPLSR